MTKSRAMVRGFTLVELFVVIAIGLVIVAVAVPSFSAMAYSSARSLAENTLRSAVAAARDVALQSSKGNDGAAVFLYDADERRMVIVVAEYVGQIQDVIDGAEQPISRRISRDVFAPVALGGTFDLPRGWMVRGYAPPQSMNVDWYDSDLYETTEARIRGNWVFPESGFYDVSRETAGQGPNVRTPRQSFMIRFEGRTGRLVRDRGEALLVDARPSSADRQPNTNNRADPRAWQRVDWAENVFAWAERVVEEIDVDGNGVPYEAVPGNDTEERARRRLIGNLSHDTVLLKDVSQVAMYDERLLASALGARDLSRRSGGSTDTGSLYASYEDAGRIEIDFQGLFRSPTPFDGSSSGQSRLRTSINNWINGDTTRNGDGTIGNGVLFEESDVPSALRLFVDTYSGELVEVLR